MGVDRKKGLTPLRNCLVVRLLSPTLRCVIFVGLPYEFKSLSCVLVGGGTFTGMHETEKPSALNANEKDSLSIR